MNNILILGAGLMQEPAIDSAHELGYAVTVFDGNPNAHCKDKCDVFEKVDLKYTEEVVQKAVELHSKTPFAAVFTAGTDFSYAVSSVAKACNLLAHPVEASKKASDKILMRASFEKYTVPSPKYLEVSIQTNDDKLFKFVSAINFPLVVKPCDNMGSRGCRLVSTLEELRFGIDDAMQYSKTSRVIVEQYMEGPEFSIDALVYNNEVTITGFADRHIFYPPYFIEMGHSMPTNIDKKNYNELIKTFVKGISALGLQHGAAKADIKLTSTGPMVGEIAARLSGGYMSGWTFPYASGLNLTKQGLLLALGKEPQDLLEKRNLLIDEVADFKVYDYPCSNHCVERAWLSIPGIVASLNYASEEKLCNVFPRLNTGDIATFPVNNVQKAGNVISLAETREDAELAARNFIKNTHIDLEKNNNDTSSFLNESLDINFPPSAFQLPNEIYEKIRNLEVKTLEECFTMPSFLTPFSHCKDWNGKTLEDSLAYIKNYCIKNNLLNSAKDFNASLFWPSFIRGGEQGVLFYLF